MNYPRFDYHHAMPTPWGKADGKHKIAAGVWDVSTPGHGGIMVGKKVARRLLSPAAIKRGMDWGSWYCYEEDCNWALFAYEQPGLYAASWKTHAINPAEITPEWVRREAHDSLIRWDQGYLTEIRMAGI